jgi:hypothetical protein
VSTFFLPKRARGDTERIYRDLREEAEVCTGAVSRDRRIQEVECRQRGVDLHLRVGEADGANGRIVEAILQLGRDIYTIHHVQPKHCERSAPTVLRRTEVYAVTDFE